MSTDDLLSPSLRDRQEAEARPPWRLSSQVWIGLLGGALPVTVIGWLNAERLGLERERRTWILVWGAVGVALTLLAVGWAVVASRGDASAQRTWTRLASRAVGLLTYLAISRVQAPADRAFRLFDGRPYASLWGPGTAAVLLLGMLQALGAMALTRWVAQ